jgi:catechol 2,3-dioxygenase
MSTNAPIDPSLGIRSVTLAVGDLPRSVDFYERVLGLPLISADDDGALLGTDPQRPALALSALADATPAPPRSTGLFHVAWLHPSRASLAATIQRIVRARWPIDGASDHGVSEALYLGDPDGLGIEIYVDRPRDQWERPADGHGVRIFTLPLDVDDLLAQAPAQPTPAMEAGTTVGHVHLKVADVPRAAAFYRDALGLEEQATMPSAAFLAAGGYHHHVGLNSWQSAGGSAPPDSAPGLRVIEFSLGEEEALRRLEQRLANAPDQQSGSAPSVHREPERLSVRDTDQTQLAFSVG